MGLLGVVGVWVALWLDCSRWCCRACAGLAGAGGFFQPDADKTEVVLSCSCWSGWGCLALSVPVLVGWERDQQRAGLAGAAGRCRCLGRALAGLFSVVLPCSCWSGWGRSGLDSALKATPSALRVALRRDPAVEFAEPARSEPLRRRRSFRRRDVRLVVRASRSF